MTIWQALATCKQKRINDPTKIASWMIHNNKYWKNKGYDYTKLTVEATLHKVKQYNLNIEYLAEIS
jgi:hypothetical protein